MKKQIEILIRLQEVEDRSTAIQSQINEMQTKTATLDDKLKIYTDSLNNARDKLEEQKKEYRQLETDSQDNEAKIAKSRETLRGVKTNKEYQAVLKGIDDLRHANSFLEDQMLTLLEQSELLTKEVTALDQDLETAKKQISTEKEIIKTSLADISTQLEKISKQKESILETMNQDMRNKYERVKKQVGAKAVVPAIKEVCQGCDINIPPQLFNELQRFDKLKFCPHCYRIVYWKAQE